MEGRNNDEDQKTAAKSNELRTTLTSRNGHGQSGWSPTGCEGWYFHDMCKNRVSLSGWPPIGCEGFNTMLKIASLLPTTLVFG